MTEAAVIAHENQAALVVFPGDLDQIDIRTECLILHCERQADHLLLKHRETGTVFQLDLEAELALQTAEQISLLEASPLKGMTPKGMCRIIWP